MNSVVTTQERCNRNETLLVRRMATSTNPVPEATQARRRTSRLQNDIQRQLRNRNDDRSLQVFIRLMQSNRCADNAFVQSPRQSPPTPPASPIPNDDEDNDDVTVNSGEPSAFSMRGDKNINQLLPQKKPSLMLNTWMGQEAAFNDSWLVMRGRNIRLQHQDHVRHALYGHRAAAQSALPRYTERSRPRGSFSPTLLFNSMKGTLSPSPDIERCHNYQRTPLRCHSGKAATARPRHSAPAQAPAAKPSEVLKSNRTLVNTKSIVIRLPDSSRTSP